MPIPPEESPASAEDKKAVKKRTISDEKPKYKKLKKEAQRVCRRAYNAYMEDLVTSDLVDDPAARACGKIAVMPHHLSRMVSYI